ncbi:WD40 repeat domain-containing protein [Mesobacillus foraminis]|uniref:WD40 repeat domain-containing protein n=1 Tax=Mesobacillus foraminis TaxID=279826 RepID=UPI001BEAC3AA|nr:WD40 repeat domain-containing protein [Mesobacillus foraminis]MBT2758034.1 WD40 repeat domain-containing protein [Mesobacillus foraminis]
MKKSGLFFVVLVFMISITNFNSVEKAAASLVEKVGTPHYSIGILNSEVGIGPNGEEAIFAISNGNPAILNVIRAKSGEKISSHALPGASQAWGTTIDPSGNVYIAGGANLYRYSPDNDSVEALGRAIASETTLWHIKSDENGRIYGGTYPNGKVFMYDPETDQFTDYGTMVEGEQYARSIAVNKNKLYVGIGTHAHLIEFDLETLTKREIPLPEKFQDQKYIYDLDIVKHVLFARVTDTSTLLVYDLKTSKWVDEIPGVKGVKVSPSGPGNQVYFNKENELHSYDLKTGILKSTGFKDTWSNKGFGWVHLDEEGFYSPSLVSVLFNGKYWVYNPQSGKYKFIEAQMEGQPIGIQSIGLGPDGNIYTSGYLTGGFASYSPTENKIKSFTGFGQAENMISTDKYLYLGVYAGGDIYRYDPTKPYDHDPSNVAEATNPKRLMRLRPYGQDRPFGFAEGDGKVFIGTVPDYGKLGGALTILEEDTGEYEVFRQVVQDQSVVSLQYHNGLVYGGTSVSGGLGSVPSMQEGKIFIFDPQTKEKVYEGTPLPGEKAIGALSFDDEGYLWGMSPGKIFKFDPQTKQVLQTKELFPFNWEGVGHYWRGAFLSYDEDGHFYGTSTGKLFKFNPESWELEILDSNAALFSKDLEGNLYFSRGTDLYKYSK